MFARTLLILLFSERATAIRTHSELEEELPHIPTADELVREVMDQLSQGAELEKTFNCQNLPGIMDTVLQETYDVLAESCNLATGKCLDDATPDDLRFDKLIAAGQRISTFSSEADRHKCLYPVITTSPEKLANIMSFYKIVLDANGDVEASKRLHASNMQILAWQEGTVQLANHVVDRKMLLARPLTTSNCPCDSCKEGTAINFKCIMRSSGEIPSIQKSSGSAAVECGKFKRGFPRFWRRTATCTVSDWKEAALHKIHTAAMLACGSATILATLLRPLNGAERADFHAACVKKEQGDALEAVEEVLYTDKLTLPKKEIVSRASNLLFYPYMVLGTSLGFGALRIAADGNLAPGTQASPGEAGQFRSILLVPFSESEDSPPSLSDVAIYSNSDLVERDEILDRMTMCEEVFETKNQVVMLEASRFQVAHVMHSWEGDKGTEAKFINELPKLPAVVTNNTLLSVGIWAASAFALFWLPSAVVAFVAKVALFAVVVALPVLAFGSVFTTIKCWLGNCPSDTPPSGARVQSIGLSQCWMDEEQRAKQNP